MKIFSNTFSTIENALDYSSQKQKVIAQNIANVDTPNYKAREVSFKSALETAVDNAVAANRTDARHYDFKGSSTSSTIFTTSNDTSYNNNGNNVDMDKEMADLATNQIYYNSMIERLNGKFQTLQTVIKGGK